MNKFPQYKNDLDKRLIIKKSLISMSVLFGVLSMPTSALAQSTPTELADLSLEALLDFDVSDGSDASKNNAWKYDYSYHRLNISGYRTGTTDLSFDDVLFSPGEVRTMRNYPVVPTDITQEVHGFSGSYSLNEKVTFSVLVPYIRQKTDHISIVPGFANFTLKSDGIGDIALNLSHNRRLDEKSIMKLSTGIRLPVGSIDIRDDTPRNGAGTLERLPYTMQIGSGTLDTAFSLSYTRTDGALNSGGSISAVVRTGMNDNNYRLANNVRAGIWARYNKNHWFQPGVRLSVRHLGSITGRDESLLLPLAFPFPAPITDPSHFGGEKAGLALSLKSCPQKNCLVSFTAEYGFPIHQNLNGIQPKENSNFSIGAGLKF